MRPPLRGSSGTRFRPGRITLPFSQDEALRRSLPSRSAAITNDVREDEVGVTAL